MAGGVPGHPVPPATIPPPVRRRDKSGSGLLLWGSVGCGALILVLIVAVSVSLLSVQKEKGGGVGGMVENIVKAQDKGTLLVSLDDALTDYRNDHKGAYPPKLQALIPKYFADKAALTADVEYTPPGPEAPADWAVISIYGGEGSMMGQQIFYYSRLLKDGSIVLDQVSRTAIPRSRIRNNR